MAKGIYSPSANKVKMMGHTTKPGSWRYCTRKTMTDNKNYVTSVELKTKDTILQRPIANMRLVLKAGSNEAVELP